jgi:hypothetical protein
MQQKKLPTEYTLEIYEPDDDSCVAAVFKSDTPFMPVAKGEYINTSGFTMSEAQGVLQVVSVEHLFWEVEGDHVAQKVCVRTKRAENPFE